MGTTLRRAAPLAAALVMVAALPGAACAQADYASDAARLVEALELEPGDTVGDIGAGGGELAIELARAVGPSGLVYATELNDDRLEEIRRAVAAAELRNVTVLEAHATRTNLPERCCDALVLRRVYHHIADPARMNASLLATVAPGGRLGVIDFDPDSAESPDPGGRADGNQHGVTSATVARELREAGFEVVAVEAGQGSERYLVVARRPQ
jgi:ubiquinone/menaquinone biosynthesis C-methylase UbiE